MSRAKIIAGLIAALLGFVHYCVGVVAIFYGSVIDPQMIHKIYSSTGILLLLPFSALIFIPALRQPGLDIVFGVMSGFFWIVVYYKLLNRLLRHINT